ncbi:unnamed protein product [Spirodela intermedia]|uniref:VOC domain-containing protein n=1 Tax=Spirodela intermedia TaxID=51605 RepID=A0A7I8LHN1_SPIIN|nr:unnamed protein product [Spirodela intermedia]
MASPRFRWLVLVASDTLPKMILMTVFSLQFESGEAGESHGRPQLGLCGVVAGAGCQREAPPEMSTEGDQQDARWRGSHGIGVVSIHHVGLLCENLERSLEFYQKLLGLEINEARPHEKLPYRGAWLWVGSEMIHLMELPNPDPLTGRPEHGGRDRHACIAIKDVSKLKVIFDDAGIQYTLSRSGRPAIFARDPDANALEFTQVD